MAVMHLLTYYRPRSKEDKVFTGVCHSFCPFGERGTAADPGFPRGGGGGANSPGGGGGRQHTILPNFPANCMKSKEFGHAPGEGVCVSQHAPGEGVSAQGLLVWPSVMAF